MTSQIKRERKELWTSYLARRLQEIGVHVGDYQFMDSTDSTVNFRSGGRISTDYEIIGLWLEITVPSSLPLSRTSDQFARNLTLEESVFIGLSDQEAIEFHMNIEGLDGVSSYSVMESHPDDGNLRGTYFRYYSEDGSYETEKIIDDIVAYALARKPKTGFPTDTTQQLRQETRETPIPVTTKQTQTLTSDPRLDQILEVVQRIDARSASNPLSLEDDNTYLTRLYTDTINDDPDSLQFLDYDGQRIPYVLVDSSQLGGIPGRVTNNLHFVARDIATELWQQHIVAYHESLCIKLGHDTAVEREYEFAKAIGKEQEHRDWRATFDNPEF